VKQRQAVLEHFGRTVEKRSWVLLEAGENWKRKFEQLISQRCSSLLIPCRLVPHHSGVGGDAGSITKFPFLCWRLPLIFVRTTLLASGKQQE